MGTNDLAHGGFYAVGAYYVSGQSETAVASSTSRGSLPHRGPPLQMASAMRLGARCPHCDADEAVIPRADYANDRFTYVCVYCGWWGLDPLRIDSPPTGQTQKRGTMLRFRRR
jgi:hypothetical protein